MDEETILIEAQMVEDFAMEDFEPAGIDVYTEDDYEFRNEQAAEEQLAYEASMEADYGE